MKRPEYVAVVTGIYAAALRQGREPTQAELAQLEAAFSRQGFTQGYFRDQKGPAMFGTRPQGARDPADLFDQARRFYTRGEHRTVPVSLTAQVQGEMPMVLTARDPAGHTAVVQGPCPQAARTRQTTADQVAGQLRKTGGTVYQAHQVQVDLAPGLSVPPVGGEQPAPPGLGGTGPGPHPAPCPADPSLCSGRPGERAGGCAGVYPVLPPVGAADAGLPGPGPRPGLSALPGAPGP